MRIATTKVVGATAALTMLVPGFAMAATADAAPGDVTWTTVPASAATADRAAADGAAVAVPNVQGQFSFEQSTVTPNWQIAEVFQKGAATFCGSETELTVTAPEDWTISVSGDVANPYTATLGEITADEGPQMTLMGCSCAANPAGGRAIINAEVTGVPLAEIIYRAQPASDVNTVTLISDDGYRMQLPLDYILARRALMAGSINGEGLGASVGGTTQVWIDATAAKYFSRNVVAIELTAQDEAPAVPGSEDAPDTEYVNRPNVGITAANV